MVYSIQNNMISITVIALNFVCKNKAGIDLEENSAQKVSLYQLLPIVNRIPNLLLFTLHVGHILT